MAATILVVIGALIVIGASITVPYYALTPGSARPTEPLVSVEGAEIFPSDGEVLFTTVHVEHLNLIDYARHRLGLLPDSWRVLTEEDYLGPNTEAENDQINANLMTNSKDVASYVALEHLGYDVTITGTGAVVLQIVDGAPASGKLELGDTIVAIDGEKIELTEQVARIVASRAPGDSIVLTIEQSDESTGDVEVTLAPREDDPDAGFLGVATTTRDLAFNLPIDVEIDSGNVGGPSAGLAFTLAILDIMTPGDLSGGEVVAVTGTMNPDGSVGAVGGVAQKVVASDDAGAEVFLAPTSELEEAAGAAPDGIRVEPVDDLDDALAVLAELGGNALALPARPTS
ncbi:MAG: YlbL family protein [Acidimicrobiales bacterium]